MDDELNATYITLDVHGKIGKYRYLVFFFMLVVYILASSFNVIIVYLIWIHKNLHEPMYIFIAALLLNSFITNTNMYPKILIDMLSEKPLVSFSACLFQFFLHYSFSSSDFLLLAAMAYDRYVSICKPLLYVTIMTKNIVIIILAVAWIVPVVHIGLSTILSSQMKICNFKLKALFCNNTFYTVFCGSSEARTLIDAVNMFNLVLFPILFILFTYTRILIISSRSGRNVRKKAAQTCSPHLIILIGFSAMCLYDVIVVQVDMGSDAHFIFFLQVCMYYPLFNPVVYGLKMKEIYKHLKRLLCQAKMS